MTNQSPTLIASLSLPPHLAARVRGIQDGGHDRFGTALIVTAKEEELAKPHWEKWLEADKDAESGLWTVAQHRAFTGAGDAPHQKETKQRDVCFFDALYYCAEFEQQERALGGTLRMDTSIQTFPHYTAAAMAASQPIDLKGLPHPAIGGKILTDGNFMQTQVDLAAQAKVVAAVPTSDATLLALPKASARLEIQPLTESFKAKLDNWKDISNIKSSIAAVDDLFKKLDWRMEIIEVVGVSQFFRSVFTLGIWCILAKRNGTFLLPGNDSIVISSNDAKRAIAKLPEGEDKTLLTQFRLAAQAIYPLERAANLYNEMKRNAIPPNKAQAGAFHLIAMAVERGGLDCSQADKLKNAWMEGGFVPKDSEIPQGEKTWTKFYHPLRERWFGRQKVGMGERYPLLEKLKGLEQTI